MAATQQQQMLNFEVVEGKTCPAYKLLEECPICYMFVVEPVFHTDGCGSVACCLNCYHILCGRSNRPKCPLCGENDFRARTTLSQMEREWCAPIKLKCLTCGKTGITLTSWKHHQENECGNRCTNKRCSQQLFQTTQEEHNQHCQYTEVKCLEEKEGCSWKGNRKAMVVHVHSECSYHMMVVQEMNLKEHEERVQVYRELQALRVVGKEKRLETAYWFTYLMYHQIKDMEHHEVKSYQYNSDTKEFAFETVKGFKYTVVSGDDRLVHCIEPNPNAKRWQDLVCKLYWVPARTAAPEVIAAVTRVPIEGGIRPVFWAAETNGEEEEEDPSMFQHD